ncbi:hypothetical protein K7432_017237 [Basidiobolus ranarum]|uniref:Uncharacterized protein n=1 Tax=Basidiobolus ranarum TaxID=34480 RepID=A0ABR2WDL8_9FUNG
MRRENCNFKSVLTFCVLFPLVYLTLLFAFGQKAVFYAIDSTSRNYTTTTLVSAYFPLTASKHSSDEYKKWLSNFLSNVNTPMVIYTTPQFAPTIQELRGDFPTIIRTQYESPFNVTPLQGLEEIYNGKQHDLDREKAYHNGNLYAIWNSKAFLVAGICR